MRLAALAAALILVAAPALAQTAAPTTLYLFLYRAGPSWQAGKPMSAQGLAPHAAYMRKLLADGKLAAGGPIDPDAGMAIVRAANTEEAKAILAEDPAIRGGILVADLRLWTPVMDSGKPLTR